MFLGTFNNSRFLCPRRILMPSLADPMLPCQKYRGTSCDVWPVLDHISICEKLLMARSAHICQVYKLRLRFAHERRDTACLGR